MPPAGARDAASTSTMFSPGAMRPNAVDDGQARQRPARQRFIGMPLDLGFRHAGIMFERQRRDRFAVLAAAADAAERDDGADIGAALW